jgi:hypothetical protein
VLSRQNAEDGSVHLRISVPEQSFSRFERRYGERMMKAPRP